MKEKIKIIVLTSLILITIAVVVGTKIYVMIEFGNTPISEIPAWAYWWLE